MLEFYPFHLQACRCPMIVCHRLPSLCASLSRASLPALAALCAAALLAACAATGGPQPSSPAAAATAEPPPPGINLSGFPLPYRQGYADGCASVGGAERKDAARFAADGNYRTGWQDGLALCRKR